jgi:hypothetical protein
MRKGGGKEASHSKQIKISFTLNSHFLNI